jgi:hypothetical protein
MAEVAAGVPAGEVDPIFAAIEAHRAAAVAFSAAVTESSELEESLPADRQQSSITALEQRIFLEDDPRWIASQEAVDVLGDAERDAACQILNVHPTTMAGVVAVLRYSVDGDRDGCLWAGNIIDDEHDGGRGMPWARHLHRMLASAIERIVAGGEVVS